MIQNGFFRKATVNGKKAAIYVNDSKIYLLSYVSAWDDGTKLPNSKGFTKIMYIDSVDDEFTESEFIESLRYTMTNSGSFESVLFEGENGFERVIKRRKNNNDAKSDDKDEEPIHLISPLQPQMAMPDMNAMTSAFSMMFAGLQQQIASGVMKDLEPTIQKVLAASNLQTRKIEVTSENGTHKVDGVTCKEFETILKTVNANIPVYMYGPAGCGKNVIAKQVAKALGLDFYFSNAVTQEYKISGFIDGNGVFHETEFYKAFTNGGLFMLDELDASIPEVLINLNAALANGYYDFPNGRVDAHKDFRVIAAGNTCGTGATTEYTGRYQIDASSLDRFAAKRISYDENIEKAISGNDTELLDFIHALRNARENTGINIILGYRAIERIVSLSPMFGLDETLQMSVLKGLQDDELRILNSRVNLTNNKYANAFASLCA